MFIYACHQKGFKTIDIDMSWTDAVVVVDAAIPATPFATTTELTLARELAATSMHLQDIYQLLRKKEQDLEIVTIKADLLETLYERAKSMKSLSSL